MDIFKQNKILISLVVILAILNILSIIGLWTIKSGKLNTIKNVYYLSYGQYPIQEEDDRLDKLANELKFNNEQKEKFKEIRNNYHNKIKVIMNEIHEVKIQILNKTLESESDTEETQNLFNKIGNHQAELEKTYICSLQR